MGFYKKYILSGKRIPLLFYVGNWFRNLLPRSFWMRRKKKILQNWENREDAEYIRDRVNVYCRLNEPYKIDSSEYVDIKEVNCHNFQSRYALDAQKVLRYFPGERKVGFKDGDIRKNPDSPTLIKCRRLNDINEEMGVILNLDSIRHWLNPKDDIPFERKEPKLFFRGDIYDKSARIKFFEQWADDEYFDLGDTNTRFPSKWSSEFVTIPDHFKYQFILALEGYDMASSLQWIMASGCIPVMPKPTVEGWLMHSKMIPGVHYIEIKPDFSDVGDKIRYYATHQDEAKKIAIKSKEFADQFKDKRRELIISILTVEKYLKNQQK